MAEQLAISTAKGNLSQVGNETEPPRITWVSINPVSANGRTDPIQRTLVRRHVMRDFYQRKRVPNREARPKPPSFKDQKSRYRLLKSGDMGKICSRSKTPEVEYHVEVGGTSYSAHAGEDPNQEPVQLKDSLSAFRKDPFILFPIDASTDTHVLFVYYMNELDNKSMAVNPESDFVPVALGDAACFHVTMAITAQIQGLRYFGTHGSQYWYHRGKALEHLHHSLYGIGKGVTEAMVCTTGMLAYTDTFHNGPINTSRQHLHGLQNLVKLKGGLEKLELCMMILRLVTWCELQDLIRLKQRLSRQSSVAPEPEVSPESSPKPSLVSYPAELFCDIQTVVRMKYELAANPNNKNSHAILNELVLGMLNRILTRDIAQVDPDSTSQEVDVDTRSIIQMSIILFSYTAYPAMTIAGAFSRSISAKLKLTLQAFDVRRLQPELHCWILTSGATAVQETTNRAWFINALADITTEQDIQYYDEFIQLLKNIVWVTGTFEAKCRQIWLDIKASLK